MRSQFMLFALAYLAALVLGGGYQGCLERVLSFQAYEIDGLNPASEQIMGFHCSLFDESVKKCMGKWVPCSGSRPGGRCNYYEFLRHLGKLPNDRNWAVYQPGSTRLDADASAKRCLHIYQTKGNGKGVRNFPPFQAMKGERKIFNSYIMRMGGVVDTTAENHKNAGNSYLWDDYDATRERTKVVRAGDHGEKLVAAAKDALGSKMTIVPLNLGPHPTDPGKPFETMDWKATVIAAKEAGVPNYKEEIRNFYNNFYSTKAAKDHRSVNRTFKKSVDRSRACR